MTVRRSNAILLAALLAVLIHIFGLHLFAFFVFPLPPAKPGMRMRMQIATNDAGKPAETNGRMESQPSAGRSAFGGAGALKKADRANRAMNSKKDRAGDKAADKNFSSLPAVGGAVMQSQSGAIQTPPREDTRRKNALPEYPVIARKRGNEGLVTLRCRVDAGGNVTGVEIAEGSGFRVLDEAARKTALKWHFLPSEIDGKPVAGVIIVPVEFRLE